MELYPELAPQFSIPLPELFSGAQGSPAFLLGFGADNEPLFGQTQPH